MKKYIVELIGTFFLVLTVGMASGPLTPLAIGSALMVMVFAGGHISGAHYNPAVTLGVLIRGKIGAAEAGGYILFQIVGGVLAALVAGYLGGGAESPKVISTGPAILAELLGTLALVYVVLNTATAKGTEGNSFYGLAIGFTVMVMAVALGGVSGGAFNPAVAIGGGMMNIFGWGNIWVYLVGTMAGGVIAAFVFKFVNGDD